MKTIEVARQSVPEDARARPKVGAAVFKNGILLATAYRGELSPGEHAEHALLEKKLLDQDLGGSTLFTTLEPCTVRNPPKLPCADWIIKRKIERVVVGILDPNPLVYAQGVLRLKNAGVTISFYPEKWRDLIRADNIHFIEQFKASPALHHSVSFNYAHNDGTYSVGHGPLLFQTRWARSGAASIHVCKTSTPLQGIAIAQSATSLDDICDAGIYDMTSSSQTAREGEFVVFKNAGGYYAVARIDDIKSRGHGDSYDMLRLTYWINKDGGPNFRSYATSSIETQVADAQN